MSWYVHRVKLINCDIKSPEMLAATSALKTLDGIREQIKSGKVVEIIVCCIHEDGAVHTELSGQRSPILMAGALAIAQFQALSISTESE